MPILNYIIGFLGVILMLPVGVLLAQVLAAIFLYRSNTSIVNNNRSAVSILMPAHNESLIIAQSIESIKPQLSAQDELIVIADNCSDDTASIASALGATVIERINKQERGKGYALDFGVQHLKRKPPKIVIVVDADCLVGNGAIGLLASACANLKRPVQALYLMESQKDANLKARIAKFAWLVKNMVRPLGFKALGLPCQLMGTGMAFLWEDLLKVNLATGHIVEDMKLGVDLARLNKAPYFLNEALVTSVFPPSEEATSTQRSRWEHGHLSVILSEVPQLIYESIKTRNLQLFGLTCDLMVPPLAMLVLMCSLVLGFSFLLGGKLLVFSTSLFGGLFLSVILAWFFFGREIISFKQLCYAPIYVLIKIPLYIKFFLNRQVEWVRSKRD